MLGLADALRTEVDSTFVAFQENGCFRAFMDEVKQAGFTEHVVEYDTPRLLTALRELALLFRTWKTELILCHSIKPNLLGLLAARRIGIPVISVSRGWTGENAKVRLYEALDRRVLRWMDRVVCVSEAQAQKVRRAGVRGDKIAVIPNAIRPERFDRPDPVFRQRLLGMFPKPPQQIVGAAGRLSPEKGFGVLVDAAADVAKASPDVGFVLFGDGVLRESLVRQIATRGLDGRFILAGFQSDLDQYFPHFDLLAIPSYTEGLPNVALEALAAGVPVVATAVGGTPEVIDDGQTGCLVPAGNPAQLADRIRHVLSDGAVRRQMSEQGRRRVEEHFSFAAQASRYRHLFNSLAGRPCVRQIAKTYVEESPVAP